MTSMATVPISADSGPSVVLELLYSLKVKDAMTRNVVTSTPSARLREVQILMRDYAITGVPILEGSRLQGIISIGDIIGAFDSGIIEHRVDTVMTGAVVTIDEDMPLSFAVTYFDRYKYGRFPVLDKEGRLSGIITASDVLRRLLIALNEEIGSLERKMASRSTGTEGPLPLMELSFGTLPLDFSRAGNASVQFKKALV
jgi:CBS domain-containing protein